MTVRGGKSRLLVFGGAGLFLVALVLLYHNAATRLSNTRKAYEKCYTNEIARSAQLQVMIEEKTQLEKSLQQERNENAQTKEELKSRVDEERQTRERENSASINKFTALQQQYKLLQSQHEDVKQELNKTKQLLLTTDDELTRLRNEIHSLIDENKHLQDDRESSNIILREKISILESENENLKKANKSKNWENEKADLQRELTECLQKNIKAEALPIKKTKVNEEQEGSLQAPNVDKKTVNAKSSTAASQMEINGRAVNYKTSTPVINPDAVESQDRIDKVLNPPPQSEQGKSPIEPDDQQQAPLPQPEMNPLRQLPNVLRRDDRNGYQAYQEEYDGDGRKEDDDDDPDHIDDNDKNPEPIGPPENVIPHRNEGVKINPK